GPDPPGLRPRHNPGGRDAEAVRDVQRPRLQPRGAGRGDPRRGAHPVPPPRAASPGRGPHRPSPGHRAVQGATSDHPEGAGGLGQTGSGVAHEHRNYHLTPYQMYEQSSRSPFRKYTTDQTSDEVLNRAFEWRKGSEDVSHTVMRFQYHAPFKGPVYYDTLT